MSPGQPAVFVVSIDLEMSWGAVHRGRPHQSDRFSSEREIVSGLLGLMEKYQIAATWAVVGHLFLPRCEPKEGIKHPEISRPNYQWHAADWYDLDPSSDVESEPTWYGPDLVEVIRSCPTHQEIGSHSFGHIIAGDPGCSPEAFRTDLAACVSVAETAGIELRSFVYPRNSIGHLDVLEEAGFLAFRGHALDRFASGPSWRKRRLRLINKESPPRSIAVMPSRHGKVLDVPQTYFFDPDSTTANRLGTTMWSWLVRRRLRDAIRSGSLFHLWFHPHNLASRPERGQRALEDLFRKASHEIESGRLENLTMGELAEGWSDPNVE